MNVLKKYLPSWLKLQVRLLLDYLHDLYSRNRFRYAKKQNIPNKPTFQITLKQAIIHSPKWENKVKNINLGAERIAEFLIQPKEIFSFWHAVKAPYPSKGYLIGRNLKKGQLVEDYGGGLCQLSGILYHLALQGSLEILERHNHSVDIYNENDRFTPLGADATVVYGYKDLKFINPYSFPIYFSFQISNESLESTLHLGQKIPIPNIRFEQSQSRPKKVILTQIQTNQGWQTIARSCYKYLSS